MTVRAAIYDLTTGRILRTIECPADFIARQAGPGESFLEVTTGVDDTSHYIADGALVPVPARPGNHHTFDYTAKQWIDPRTLSDLKAAKWAEIKGHRDTAEFATFTYSGMVFDGDLDAQRRLTAYISISKSAIAAGQPFAAEFILANNQVVTLTAQNFVGIELAKVQAVAAAFAHAAALRLQIEAATTAAELDALAW